MGGWCGCLAFVVRKPKQREDSSGGANRLHEALTARVWAGTRARDDYRGELLFGGRVHGVLGEIKELRIRVNVIIRDATI